MNRVARRTAYPIAIRVRNVSPAVLWVVGVVDGAESGARYPHWRATVVGPRGAIAPPETPDFVRPLLPADFKKLKPGESFDPTAAGDSATWFPIAAFALMTEQKGAYDAELELDMQAEEPEAWMGDALDRREIAETERTEALRLLRAVPRITVRSNRIRLVVD